MAPLNNSRRLQKKEPDLRCWENRLKALSVVSKRLNQWQKTHGRHGLAWQTTNSYGFRDPYKVWLSEVMLQQTQVGTAIPYFDKFVTRYSNIEALAEASLDDVFSMWSGLGYYRRARFLHACAQTIVADHQSHFPQTTEALCKLPGIGKTTAAAISSFCFGQRVSIFDGNVERVTSRWFAFSQDLSSQKNRNTLWALADQLVPERAQDMPVHTQALMDLGATVCKPLKPLCSSCPVSDLCEVHTLGVHLPDALPLKSRKTKRVVMQSFWLWLECEDCVWLEKRPSVGLWAGLWTLPLMGESEVREFLDRHTLLAKAGKSFKHVLTHRDWMLHPLAVQIEASEMTAVTEDPLLGVGRWVRRQEWQNMGVPGPTKSKLTCWDQQPLKNSEETVL